jgi:peptidoglycan/LPS O-acetylase OafA/YrhL
VASPIGQTPGYRVQIHSGISGAGRDRGAISPGNREASSSHFCETRVPCRSGARDGIALLHLSPIGLILPLACLILAITTAALLVHVFGEPPPLGRFVSIDGLRGYLALAVFISHTAVWYHYLRSGEWTEPPSRGYLHLGQSSVALFFMITGFLFCSKVLAGRLTPIDWTRLYLSRICRLFPLYIFVVCILFLIVAYASNGELKVPLFLLVKACLQWILFTLAGGPDINGLKDTSIIVAGVTWSLFYEWYLYISLPILAVVVGALVPKRYVVLSIVGIAGLSMLHPFPMRLLAFVGGIAASACVRNSTLCRLAKSRLASLLAIGCLYLAAREFPTAYAALPLLLLSITFIVIACGNTVFGALAHPYSRMLGDVSYGIYLLHGIVLFCAFRLLIGVPTAAALSGTSHCLIAMGCTPIVVLVSFGTYRLVELPGMRVLPPPCRHTPVT